MDRMAAVIKRCSNLFLKSLLPEERVKVRVKLIYKVCFLLFSYTATGLSSLADGQYRCQRMRYLTGWAFAYLHESVEAVRAVGL